MPANIRVDQRGITGLETAIVLIAFVVVASVFAFGVLNTGLLSSEKSKEAALGGLEETSATLSIRGKVIAEANAGKTAIDTLKFNLTPLLIEKKEFSVQVKPNKGAIVIVNRTLPGELQCITALR